MTETKPKHTPEPWWTGGGSDAGVFTSKCQIIADCRCGEFRESTMSIQEIQANAARIVSCVNACEGINPEAVPDILRVLKSMVEFDHEFLATVVPGLFLEAEAAIAKVEGETE